MGYFQTQQSSWQWMVGSKLSRYPQEGQTVSYCRDCFCRMYLCFIQRDVYPAKLRTKSMYSCVSSHPTGDVHDFAARYNLTWIPTRILLIGLDCLVSTRSTYEMTHSCTLLSHKKYKLHDTSFWLDHHHDLLHRYFVFRHKTLWCQEPRFEREKEDAWFIKLPTY